MSPSPREEDDVELVPVPMGRETRARLVRFARATGRKPQDAAAALLDDLLVEDEIHNAPAVRPAKFNS